jgi:2-phosphoglycolate phosphatase
VIFDLDGTLVDSKRDIAVSVNHMLAVLGLPGLPLGVIESLVGSGAEKLVRKSMGEAASGMDIGGAIRIFREHYVEHCLDTTRDFPVIRDSLEVLSSNGIGMSVLTNKPSDICRRILDGLGLSVFFDPVLGSEDVPALKPDPAASRLLSGRTGVDPEEMLMVGDSPMDAGFARNSGMKCALVLYGGITPDKDNRSAGADYIFETPFDLFNFFKAGIGSRMIK